MTASAVLPPVSPGSPGSPGSEPSPARPRTRKSLYLLIAAAVLALDQWTKWLIESHLPEMSSHEVIPGLLHISHVRNTPIALFST